MWSLTVHHRHAVNGDYSVTSRCLATSETGALVAGADRL